MTLETKNMRVLLAQLNPTVGDLEGNLVKILSAIAYGKDKNAQIVLCPELALTGYPPDDFLLLPHFIDGVEASLQKIIQASQNIAVVVGLPRRNSIGEKYLYNSAAIIENGVLLGFQDKWLLPTYDVFDERRYFDSGLHSTAWVIAGKRIGITICEDIWQHSALLSETAYHRDPLKELKSQKLDCVLNLSASPYSVKKPLSRLAVASKAATALGCPLLLCNQVGGNDSLIFDGHSLCVTHEGKLFASAKGFAEDYCLVDLSNQPSTEKVHAKPSEELYQALVLGVRDYFHKSGFKNACLGLSGGIDSAVVACIAVEALGKENVVAVGLPSRYSSRGSLDDAKQLAENLGIAFHVIPIEKPFAAYLELLAPEFNGMPADATEENLQARIRGMILMALSNKHGYIVLSTGNKSELAVGYSTLYGDMCGGLGVISDLTKRQVYALARWINQRKQIIPEDTLTKPPSAELRPGQLDSDSLPDYDVVDNIVEAYVEGHLSASIISEKFGYDKLLVESLIQKIHRNEYKRRQSAPGLRVTEKAFSTGRYFPIVQGFVTANATCAEGVSKIGF